ncbi:asparagine synthase (glutamine-hydrolyzing) [Candidatus Odyssella thessalonicensis]|uniref:asparagine synthase (glutamine-hydrolyzing) n=1 Tax=Candidatus Odyssella thessalonicensis TaxID=84647 RepID=UPI000225A8FC|nr:asparagine synthase (glutamine-hydrolyzing) [Candidatus Odyssella thessalonicensis]
MCGFSGFYHNSPRYDQLTVLQAMTQAISHRGPDGESHWLDPNGIALGHRRLAILDLSENGRQPMHSHSGRLTMIFNGECYNYQKLRAELDAQAPRQWRGHSDTEVILEAIDHWGMEATLKKMMGMFAIALWDHSSQSLILARDRIGEKPLYFGWSKGALLFGSELKALKVHPCFASELNEEAVDLMIRYGYVPSGMSIYKAISKLTPGTYRHFTQKELQNHLLPEECPYWRLEDNVVQNSASYSDPEAVDGLESLLTDAIGQQMIADVPLGAFLSGGVDSSTIVALMQKQSTRPVKTFSIGFHEAGFNEAEYAKAVANHLKTDHTELYVTHQDALDVIPNLPTIYCEPFADSSQIPTYLVARMARQQVTVSLSGDAGDELFAGYNRYLMVEKIWNSIRWLPQPLRHLASQIIKVMPIQAINKVGQLSNKLPSQLGDKLRKVADILPLDNLAIYDSLTSHWKHKDPVTLRSNGNAPFSPHIKTSSKAASFTEQMMFLDTLSYLVDDILVKVDRAAMANSLETRVPLLDHRVVEYAWSLPLSQKLRHGQTKWPLRQVLYRYVPRELIERPKQGFGVPLDQWLRGTLKEWAEELLSTEALRQSGLLNVEFVQRKWQEHLSGKRNWQYGLWNILMFQAWLKENA